MQMLQGAMISTNDVDEMIVQKLFHNRKDFIFAQITNESEITENPIPYVLY